MHSLRATAALWMVAMAGWAGGTPAGPPRPGAGKPGAEQSKSDAAIERDIRARFAKSKINEDKFQVHVQGGIATIEGKTGVIQHKGVATRLAKSAGAAAVANHIEISDAAREKAARNLETGRRRAQIKRGDARSEVPETRQSR